MGKKIALIVGLLFLVSLAFAQEKSKYTDTIVKFFEQQFAPGTVSYRSWQEGCKENWGLDLQKIKFNVDIVEEVIVGEIVYVRVIAEYNGLCLDKAGLKKRVNTIREIGFRLKDEAILNGISLSIIKDLVVLDGWNEKDI